MSATRLPLRLAVPEPSIFPEQTILGYRFIDRNLLNECFVLKPEHSNLFDSQYPDGNRRLAVLGDTVIRTYICQMWYDAADEPRHFFNEWIKHVNNFHYLGLLARKHGLDFVIGDVGGVLWSDADQAFYASHAGRNESPVQLAEHSMRMRDKQLARVVQALVAAVFNDSHGDAPTVQRFMWEGLGIKKPKLVMDNKAIKLMVAEDLANLEREVAELEKGRAEGTRLERAWDGEAYGSDTDGRWTKKLAWS